MSVLPITGPLSMGDIRTEYGLGGEIGLSQVYRGSIGSSYTSPTKYQISSPTYYWYLDDSDFFSNDTIQILWAGTLVAALTGLQEGASITSLNFSVDNSNTPPAYTITAVRSTLQSSSNYNSKSGSGVMRYYSVYLLYNINETVPNSGQISISNFRGQGSPRYAT